MDVDAVLGGLYERIAPHLTEKQRRLLAGAAARALGRGGGARMARISGLSRPTVYTGVRELDDQPDLQGRVRRAGGGRKRLTERYPGLLQALDGLVDLRPAGIRKARCGGRASPPASSPTRWVRKGSRPPTTASGGCSSCSATRCSAPKRPRRAPSTPTGTRSFAASTSRPSNSWPLACRSSAWTPRRKELVGRYANGGAEWQPTGEAERVGVHDFPDPTVGKAIPYGVDDLGTTPAG